MLASVAAAIIFAGPAIGFGVGFSQVVKLTAEDAAEDDRLGAGVAISGDTMVVGATGAGTGGVAYVFVRTGQTWTQQAKLTADDTSAGDEFGRHVAVDGNTIIVSAS